jgi:hypothetical protein
MKRLALAAIVLSVVACSSADETMPADTATVPAAAPAPAVTTDSMPADTMAADSTADTTATVPPAN